MDSYYLSLLEGAGGVRRERLPGGLGQAQLAAGGSNQGGGVVRNMCETCGEAGEFSQGKSISYLTALLRNLKGTVYKLVFIRHDYSGDAEASDEAPDCTAAQA